jgi:hypothetical protein
MHTQLANRDPRIVECVQFACRACHRSRFVLHRVDVVCDDIASVQVGLVLCSRMLVVRGSASSSVGAALAIPRNRDLEGPIAHEHHFRPTVMLPRAKLALCSSQFNLSLAMLGRVVSWCPVFL